MMTLVVVTASWLPVPVGGWVDAGGHIFFTDDQVAIIAATAAGRATLERRLSGGWLQRIHGEEPCRVLSTSAAGSEFFQLAADFSIVPPSTPVSTSTRTDLVTMTVVATIAAGALVTFAPPFSSRGAI